MNIAFIYFTFVLDEEAFNLSLLSLKKQLAMHEDITADIYVYDQEGATLSAIPDGVNYEVSSFPRGNNINGKGCVMGMYKIYKDIAAKGYDWIIKIDSDVFVKDLSYLYNLTDESAVGDIFWFSPHYNCNCFTGACYTMNPTSIFNMESQIKKTFVRCKLKGYSEFTEDGFFSRLITYGTKPITEDTKYFSDYYIICKTPLVNSSNRDEER